MQIEASQIPQLRAAMVAEVIEREGGYVNHPADRGGPTRYGITQAKAREYGYRAAMQNAPLSLAHRIYSTEFWHRQRLDEIAPISAELATYLFDFGIHSGTGRPGRQLQRLLNVFNRRETDYADVSVDGVIGDETLGALRALHKRRGDRALEALAYALNGLRVEFMVSLAESRESQEAFTLGWLARVMELTVPEVE